ncbi:MAG: caspase family protein [Desulfomicrobium sp.]
MRVKSSYAPTCCICLILLMVTACKPNVKAVKAYANAINKRQITYMERNSSLPIFIIERGTHPSLTFQSVVTSDGKHLITVGSDKTIRVWDFATGKQIAILRANRSPGDEGRLLGLALSPDDALLAVEVIENHKVEGQEADNLSKFIKVYSLQTDEFLSTIPYPKEYEDGIYSIQDFHFDPSASKLAIGYYGDDNVICIWSLAKQTYESCFEVDGTIKTLAWLKLRNQLIVASLRDDKEYTLARYDPTTGEERQILFSAKANWLKVSLADVSISPNERTITLTLNKHDKNSDTPNAFLTFLLDSYTGKTIREFSSTGIEASPGTLNSLAPFFDNNALIFVKEEHGGYHYSLYDVRKQEYIDQPISFQKITDVSPGKFIIGLNAKGTITRFSKTLPPSKILKVASHQIYHSLSFLNGSNVLGFDIESQEKLKKSYGESSCQARQATFALNLNNIGKNEFFKQLDNPVVIDITTKPKILHFYSRCGIQYEGTTFLAADFGSRLSLYDWSQITTNLFPKAEAHKFLDYHKRLVDFDGHTGEITGLAYSPDRRLIASAATDGTIRIWNAHTGECLLIFCNYPGEGEWVAASPSGYYASSVNGDRYVGWQLNKGVDQAPEFYTAQQFERIFYRPDFIQAVLRYGGDTPQSRAVLGRDAFDIDNLDAIAPPKVRILSPDWGHAFDEPYADIRFSVDKRSLPMLDYSVYINDIPVVPASERILSGKDKDSFQRVIRLPLIDHNNTIRIEAFNGKSMGLAETFVTNSRLTSSKKGDLYFLAVGVDRFPDMPQYNLDFAARDAEELAAVFKATREGQFRRVHAKLLSDAAAEKPTKVAILRALDSFSQAKAEDTVILFLASHGVSDSRGNYYFVPCDAKLRDLKTLLFSDGASPEQTTSLISWEDFFGAMRKAAGKRLLIVDTCQARKMEGTLDVYSLAKRSASASFALLVASRGDEFSQEYPKGGHGLFTYSLLQGLRGAADANKDRTVSLEELSVYTAKTVARLRDAAVGPQTPQLIAPDSLRNMVVGAN